MIPQRTLRRAISCAGIGLHSGKKVTLSLLPAPADSGIRFRRLDLGGIEIPAHVSTVTNLSYATTLSSGEARAETVEHLLAALMSQGIDNVIVEMTHPEVPIMDGSSAPFIYLLQEAGVRKLASPRRYLKVRTPVSVANGDKRMTIYPADEYKITYSISFDHPLLRSQSRTATITEDTFAEDLAPARTFGFLKEVEMMRQRGLALGGSLDNAVVLGESGVLNTLRFDDEFVRHKMLDCIGDLALVGHPIIGHVVVERGGHALHTSLAAALVAQPEAWDLVELPSEKHQSSPVVATAPMGSAAVVR